MDEPQDYEIQDEQWQFFNILFNPLEYIYHDYIDQPQPIRTYLQGLDDLLSGGLKPGVWCVMAEPGAGKSAFGLQLAWYTAFTKIPSFYISLEMPAHQCWARIVSAYSFSNTGRADGIERFMWSDVPSMGIQARQALTNESGNIDMALLQDYSDSFINATKKMEQYCPQLFITDAPQARNMSNLQDIIRQSKAINTGLVVVDYMQQIQTNQQVNVYDRITEVSAALKDIANELRIPIVVIVSMNRETLKGGKDPSMHGGSGSAAIEYDAVGVMTLQHIEDQSDDNHRRVRLKVQKNRFGIAGKSIDLDFYPAYNIFFESPKHETPKEA